MAFVLEYCIGFFVRLITLVLSQNKGILEGFKPKSLSCYFSQRLCAQQILATIYSGSAMDNATQACFLLCHEIRLDPSK